MALVASSQLNKTLKIFNSKLYKIRTRPLDFLVQNVRAASSRRNVVLVLQPESIALGRLNRVQCLVQKMILANTLI